MFYKGPSPSASADTHILETSISNLNRSPLPASEAQNRLDDSVRMLLEAADGLNGKSSECVEGDVHRISILNTRLDISNTIFVILSFIPSRIKTPKIFTLMNVFSCYSASSAKSNASHSSYAGRLGVVKPNSNRAGNSYTGFADTSFGSGGGSSLRDEDIVRIRVPYNRYHLAV